jgi:DUF971 family protein
MTASPELYPTRLEIVAGDAVQITWSDGRCDTIAIRLLRQACPCAHCVQERAQPPAPKPLLPVLTPQQARPLAIVAMQPVGTYAYGITFSDGHSSGIFTYEFLRSLA